ncbi:XRE family transcriptional regulator [Reinekea sp. G2M2-21]|uniref:XRE family transcriptional regulator n=1 Tax=Reinekea sp. G2M2-21 TaxID=2788942 RepID=UPI0018AA9A74|nr:XRE family transcriptional regulator [Reinekea sp. G2M2-21]
METLITAVLDENGRLTPKNIAKYFHTELAEVLEITGVPESAASKRARIYSVSNQTRMREVLEIINQVEPWTGNSQAAWAWYRSEPLPAFGNVTAESLVRSGHTKALKAFLNGIAVGGFA